MAIALRCLALGFVIALYTTLAQGLLSKSDNWEFWLRSGIAITYGWHLSQWLVRGRE